MPSHCRMRLVDRDLIRGGHYGQRSCEPRQKAEHMAAPTNAAKREESPCQHGAVHTWHKASVCSVQLKLICRLSFLTFTLTLSGHRGLPSLIFSAD